MKNLSAAVIFGLARRAHVDPALDVAGEAVAVMSTRDTLSRWT
jgi:hypothetical protein